MILLGLESPTHSLVDVSMRCLPTILPVLDFSSVKDELFPPIASVFAKTGSLLIKVRGLEAFVVLCGGTNESAPSGDDLSGIMSESRSRPSSSASILDKYTIQEKLLPLLKAIKTKEPAVMMAALKVFQQIGYAADVELVALEMLPILWSFSLGPLLNVQQFAGFMELIKSLSSKIEREHTRKLQELASTNGAGDRNNLDSTFGGLHAAENSSMVGTGTSDFERLVLGKDQSARPVESVWGVWESSRSTKGPAAFGNISSSTPQTSNASKANTPAGRTATDFRSITPDMNMGSFPSLQPAPRQQGSSFSPLQPSNTSSWSSSGGAVGRNTQLSSFPSPSSASLDPTGTMSQEQPVSNISPFTIAPPPSTNAAPASLGQVNLQIRPANSRMQNAQSGSRQQQKQGLDKYESLI